MLITHMCFKVVIIVNLHYFIYFLPSFLLFEWLAVFRFTVNLSFGKTEKTFKVFMSIIPNSIDYSSPCKNKKNFLAFQVSHWV